MQVQSSQHVCTSSCFQNKVVLDIVWVKAPGDTSLTVSVNHEQFCLLREGVLNAAGHQWDTSASWLKNRLLVNYNILEMFYRSHINLVMNVFSVYLSFCREKIL